MANTTQTQKAPKASTCKGVRNGYNCCPWPITGGIAQPYYDLQEKLEKEGGEDSAGVVKSIRLEMVEMMVLLDKMVFTTPYDKAKEILPGLEVWMKDIQDKWGPEDCYCGEGVKAPALTDEEKDRLKTLWTKSRVLANS